MHLFPVRRREPPPMGPDSDDAELLAGVAAGRVEALRLLHQRHAPWLRARPARRCADPDLVDDALQDTFVSVWRDARRFRASEGEAAAWIWTIAFRRLISALRRPAAPAVPQPDARLITESAEDTVLAGVEHGRLGEALARLSPELRAAIQGLAGAGPAVRRNHARPAGLAGAVVVLVLYVVTQLAGAWPVPGTAEWDAVHAW